jgi:YidC/Oxa1 family membrane protein insertase
LVWDGKYFAIGLLFPTLPSPPKFRVTAEPPLKGVTLVPLVFPAGTTITVKFVGLPKEFKLLRILSDSLDRILDFGWSGFLARPLTALLHFFYALFHNYGVAIIVLTLLVRLLLYPLTFKSFQSMQKLARLRPRFEEIQKKYKDDPRRLQEELLKLYRSEKVNPFSGCLPLLLQLPVFIALYNVLLVSVELRHAPFLLWIRDLSAPDTLFSLSLFGFSLPFRPLPLAMGITTYIQMKLSPSPQTIDPVQRTMLNIMPIFLTIISYSFPSGLVLYWFVSNLFSIGQQWWMMKKLPWEPSGSTK